MRDLDSYIIEKLKINKNINCLSKEGEILIDFISKDHPEMAKILEECLIKYNFYDFTVYVEMTIQEANSKIYDSIKKEIKFEENYNKCTKLFNEFDLDKDNIYYKKDSNSNIENIWAKENAINVWACQIRNKPRINIFLEKNE